MQTYTQTELQTLFLDWYNNFLSVIKFAEHYNFTKDEALDIIERGRIAHEALVEQSKKEKSL